MSKVLFLIAVVLIASLRAPAAQAARLATVDKATPLYKGPKESSVILRQLTKGTRVTASNYPTEGFYKVRTVQKELGWVKADTLDLDRAPIGDSTAEPQSEDPGAPRQ